MKLLPLVLVTIQLLSFSWAWPTSPKPDSERVPVFARWLVNQSSWGVLSTLDSDNAPFGNVVSYSTAPTGILYFFLTTTFDPTGMNAINNPKSSFALSEYPLGSCEVIADPQTPNCSKITLNGKLKVVEEYTREDAIDPLCRSPWAEWLADADRPQEFPDGQRFPCIQTSN